MCERWLWARHSPAVSLSVKYSDSTYIWRLLGVLNEIQHKERLGNLGVQMLAAGIKFLFCGHLAQLHPFVDEETDIQHLPNPLVYLQIETPSGPSFQMVLF